MIHLIPMPRKVKVAGRKIPLARFENLTLPTPCPQPVLNLLVTLADEWEKAAGKRLRFACSEVAGPALRLRLAGGNAENSSEAYRLKISASEILLEAASGRGLFYGIQTLRQLIRTEGAAIPAADIDDAPDYPVRGFYHDCTRGKVPTLETLFRLADKLAYYKINQLQLYIEHTFAFARHSDMWSGADPLTAEEIIRLDQYCRERYVDLVPSLSTFGHFYMGLRSKRKRHLNELDIDASELPFSFRDRMAHYTLNASDPESIKLVEDMLAEFLPLFSSRYFNICCDETFDLGKGKNAKKAARDGSTAKLYFGFLQKIIKLVKKQGKTAMFWGDIIAQEPQLIGKLPPDTIPLEWDYSPAAQRRDTRIMKDSGLSFYICPGVSGWNTFLNRIDRASQNIRNYAAKGLKFGASGLLNTDWGDFGHVNLLGCSIHGLVLGAACGWNCRAAGNAAAFDRDLSLIELGDPSCELVAAWKDYSDHRTFEYGDIARLFDPGYLAEELAELTRKNKAVPVAQIRKTLSVAENAEQRMLAAIHAAKPLDPLIPEEIVTGLRGCILMNEAMAAILKKPGYDPREIADRLRAFEVRFSALWHRRNKPSEYWRVKDLLMKISGCLDGMI